MNTYERLAAALEKNAYKKGKFVGDAPADPSRRSRRYIRIVKHPDGMAVKMHRADILTAYPDGRFMIDLNGWETAPTTREAINEALREYRGVGVPYMCIHSVKVFGLSQTGVWIDDKTYRYTSRMEFDDRGNLLSKPATFNAQRVDTDESKEFRKALVESGFKGMYPLMYATAPADNPVVETIRARHLRTILTDAEQAHRWSNLIASFKYGSSWVGAAKAKSMVEIGDAKSCWAKMMAPITESMRRIVESDTTVLICGIKPKFSPASK